MCAARSNFSDPFPFYSFLWIRHVPSNHPPWALTACQHEPLQTAFPLHLPGVSQGREMQTAAVALPCVRRCRWRQPRWLCLLWEPATQCSLIEGEAAYGKEMHYC